MKGIRALLAATGVAVIGYALYRYYKRQAEFIKQYEYKVIGLRIVSFKKDLVSFDVTTRIINNSNVEATVKEIYLDMYLNGVKVGNVDEVKDIFVKSKGFTDFTFRFSFNPQVVLGNLFNLVTMTLALKEIIFILDGYVKVESGFVKVTIPFTYENNLKDMLKK